MAQYRQDETDISLSMLLEVVDALKGYGADVVIVGGWAPYRSCRNSAQKPMNSM
jgi:hypothetical protein